MSRASFPDAWEILPCEPRLPLWTTGNLRVDDDRMILAASLIVERNHVSIPTASDLEESR